MKERNGREIVEKKEYSDRAKEKRGSESLALKTKVKKRAV